MGVHRGRPERRSNNYFGPPLNRAARLMAAADGRQILVSGDVERAIGREIPADTELVPLGLFELKDVSEPIEVFSVRAHGVEVARRPDKARALVVGNLPEITSELVGRSDDLTSIRNALGSYRLVSLVGPGGVGKTSLALDAARGLDSFGGGRWFVRLGNIGDDEAVFRSVHDALGQSATASTLDDLISDSLRDRHLLLVLDNCEHVMKGVITLVATVLAGTPNVRVLVTSREPLHVAGERVVTVAPLRTSTENGQLSPAGTLFVRRAGELGMSFDTPGDLAAIERLSARLDGLPLAIELASAKTRALTPTQLLDLLDDRFRLLTSLHPSTEERHQTLRATFEWSYDTLRELERRMFDELGVFASAFDLDDAVAICAHHDVTAADAIEALTALVDKSLVASTGTAPQYLMLNSLRDFARERLAERHDLGDVRRRHASRCGELASAMRAACVGPRERGIADLVIARSPDFEAAVRWAADHGEIDLALSIVVDLNAFGFQRGWRQAPTWIDELIDRPPEPLPAAWADFLAAAANTTLNEAGAITRARGLADRALELDPENPQALLVLAHLSTHRGECYELGTRAHKAGISRSQITAELNGLAYQAFGLLVDGKYEETFDVASELRRRGALVGDRSTIGWGLYFEARALSITDPARAVLVLEDARAIAEETRNPTLEISSRRHQAAALLAGGDPEAAIASVRRLVLRTLEFGETDQALRTCALGAMALAELGHDDVAAQLIGRLGLPVRTRDDVRAYRRVETDLARRLGARFAELKQTGAGLSINATIDLTLAAVV